MRKWYPVAVVVAAFAASAAVYGRLPEQIPVHWDMHGNVDRYGSRLDTYLPAGSNILVSVGQRAVGGETVLADLGGGAERAFRRI